MESILHPGFLLLHFGLGGRSDLHNGNTTDEFRKSLLELLAIIVGSRGLDLAANLVYAALDVLLGPRTIDDDRVVLIDADALGFAEVLDRNVLELEAQFFGDDLAARENGHILEHGLPAVAKARGLDCRYVDRAADLVDHQRGQGFTLDILGDDQKRASLASDLLEDGKEILHIADLLLVQENQGLFENAFHGLGIRYEVGREIATVELHALDDVQLGLEALSFLNRDDAFLADLVHGLGDDAANRRVAIGRNRTDLRDLLSATGGLGKTSELRADGLDCCVDATLQIHGVDAGDDQLASLTEDRLGENRRGGRSITRDIRGLACDLFDHLSTHVLEPVLKLNFLGDGNSVLCHSRGAEALLDNDISTLRAERYTDCVGESVDTRENLRTGILIEENFFGHCCACS